MNIKLIRLAPLLILLSSLLQGAPVAKQTPPLSKIVVRILAPDIKEGSFAAKSKTIYRGADTYLRLEEQPDPLQHIQMLIICNPPDNWMIDLLIRTGRHIVDPGPTFVAHSPIVTDRGASAVQSPEFGQEMDFFQKHNATSLGIQLLDGQRYEASQLTIGNYKYVLYVSLDTHQPYQLDIFKDGKADFSVRYLSYETGLPFDASLFKPPTGIQMTDEISNKEGSPSVRVDPALGKFMASYYQKPNADQISSVISEMQKDGFPNKDSQLAPIIGFFAEVFAANPDKLPGWQSQIEKTTWKTKEALELAIKSSGSLDKLLSFDPSKPNPGRNDMCWGAFFASGKEKYLEAIVQRLAYINERVSLMLYMTAASAEWSLSSNAREHPKVKQFLLEREKTAPPVIKAAIDEALTNNPGELKSKMIEFAREQHKKGAW